MVDMGLAIAALLLPCAASGSDVDTGAEERGKRLFVAGEGLVGTMETYQAPLPSAVIRCSNCHAGGLNAAGQPSAGGALKGDDLTSYVRRRNGPPSRYTDAALCKLLRTGVDPAGIYVAESMPRYRIDDGACRDLFVFLQMRT